MHTAKEVGVAWRPMHSGFITRFASEPDNTYILDNVFSAKRVVELVVSEQDDDTGGTT